MKTSVSLRAPRLVALLAFAFASLSVSNLSAQTTVSTVPVGAVTFTVGASVNGTTYNVSQISAPLLAAPVVLDGLLNPVTPSGLLRATIDSATSNVITSTSAGWTAAQLANVNFPMYVRLLSGAQAGLTMQITANTASTLTVNNQGVDLSTVAGSTYEIVAGDTILGLFGTGTLAGTGGVKGGTAANFTANQTDRVTINNGASVFNYYFNTDAGQWRRSGSGADQGTVAITPQSGIVYSRIATSAFSVTAVGSVPVGNTKIALARQGLAIYGRQFPTDTTLGALGLESVTNWRQALVSGVTVANSDRVIVNNGGSIFSYYYDGVAGFWKRSGSGATQSGVVIPATASIRILRGGAVGTDYWTLSPNYSL